MLKMSMSGTRTFSDLESSNGDNLADDKLVAKVGDASCKTNAIIEDGNLFKNRSNLTTVRDADGGLRNGAGSRGVAGFLVLWYCFGFWCSTRVEPCVDDDAADFLIRTVARNGFDGM
jgi:hypothetical protein